MKSLCRHLSPTSIAQKIVNWATTGDRCVHAANTTVGKIVQTRRDCLQLAANSVYTTHRRRNSSRQYKSRRRRRCVLGLTCRRLIHRYVSVDAPGDDEYAETDDVTCLPRCRGDVTFRAADRRFAGTWQIVWASLSMTSSLVTVLTFVVDSSRFRYPERPVVFVALSRYVPSSPNSITPTSPYGKVSGKSA